MGEAEALQFEKDPLRGAIITLRMWDERAKEPNKEVPPMKAYESLMRKHCSKS